MKLTTSVPFASLALAAMVTAALAGASPPAQSANASTQAPQVRFVTQDPDGSDYGPQFSPDSQRLVFERSPLGGGKEQAYAVPLQGGVPTPFLKEPLDVRQTRLRWSPTGDRIAFTGIARDHSESTWLVNADGRHARPAYASSGQHIFYPSWYPGGTRIAEMDADAQAIRVVDLHTGKATHLAFQPSLLTGMTSVSPDGRTIAVAAQESGGKDYDQSVNRIWLISEQGKAHPLEPNALQGRAPTWSPDGGKVVFESNRDSPKANDDYAIFVADRDGTHVRRLTPFELDAQHPVWSPDGRWIAFSARQAKARGKFDTGIAIIAAPDKVP